MGWAYGENSEGRPIGYGVVAVCDFAGCEEVIDRGLAYLCGDVHDDDAGCNLYFCFKHLYNHNCTCSKPDEDVDNKHD